MNRDHMNRDHLARMTKLEIVVRGSDTNVVTALLTASGATGYTNVSGVSGFGHHGHREGRFLFNETDGLALVLTVLPDDAADAVVAGLRELFEDHPGVFFVSDVWVSRAAYFTRAEAG